MPLFSNTRTCPRSSNMRFNLTFVITTLAVFVFLVSAASSGSSGPILPPGTKSNTQQQQQRDESFTQQILLDALLAVSTRNKPFKYTDFETIGGFGIVRDLNEGIETGYEMFQAKHNETGLPVTITNYHQRTSAFMTNIVMDYLLRDSSRVEKISSAHYDLNVTFAMSRTKSTSWFIPDQTSGAAVDSLNTTFRYTIHGPAIVKERLPKDLPSVLKEGAALGPELATKFLKLTLYQMLSILADLKKAHVVHRAVSLEYFRANFESPDLKSLQIKLSNVDPAVMYDSSTKRFDCSGCFNVPELHFGAVELDYSADIWSLTAAFLVAIDEEVVSERFFELFSQIRSMSETNSSMAHKGLTLAYIYVKGNGWMADSDSWAHLKALPGFDTVLSANKELQRDLINLNATFNFDWKAFEEQHDSSMVDLLHKMLVINPTERISVEEALAHSCFDDLADILGPDAS